MSELSPVQTEVEATPPPEPIRRRRLPQITLRTLVLLVAVIAAWTSYELNRREIESLNTRIASARPLARDLMIDDATKIAVVKLEEMWYDENRWDLYLPPGRYQLCIATREIDHNGPAPVVKRTAIPPGRHRIALEQHNRNDGHRVQVWVDGVEALSVEEPPGWDPGEGSSGGGQHSVSTQFPVANGVELFHRKFQRHGTPGSPSPDLTKPANGIVLWIEPDNNGRTGQQPAVTTKK